MRIIEKIAFLKIRILYVYIIIYTTSMEKDFDAWNEYKKELEIKNQTILYKEGEIWWTSIGVNIGNESCGK